jgi:selenoprotein W-related protein
MSDAEVEIEYCVPCGFLDRALDIQRAVLQNFGESLDSAALVTGERGVLDVRVDGESVWNKEDDEYDVDEIVRRVKAAL